MLRQPEAQGGRHRGSKWANRLCRASLIVVAFDSSVDAPGGTGGGSLRLLGEGGLLS